MTDPLDMLSCALYHARNGWPVFPCQARSKLPATPHGFKDASTDPGQITRWWSRCPDYNLALATGPVSGVFVLDIDPRNDGDMSLVALEEEFGPLPETLTALTGGGGRHLFFEMPDFDLKCGSNQLAAGIDIKAQGGYVILPPSIHESGRRYLWQDAEVRPTAAPAWLLERLGQTDETSQPGPTSCEFGEPGGNVIPAGCRNEALASLAGGMRRMGMGFDEIIAALSATNSRCRPPLSPGEIAAIARSICRYAPDQVTVALVENHYRQVFETQPDDIVTLSELIDNFQGLNPPVIHGLLREGETMNIIASPKVGKSWFVCNLGISITSGLDWLDFETAQGQVLHIDNEMHANTLTYRYMIVAEALGIDTRLFSHNLHVKSLRGKLRDLHALGEYFNRLEPGQYKTIILDAFYRTLPLDTDENDNGAIAGLYNTIDTYASRLKCAFVLVHHTSKGNQAGKSVTDVGAGAGSQSRAADTHLVLRPHEEEDTIVLEAALRSWAPVEPLALRWKWPLFTPDYQADTTALKGAVKPPAKKETPGTEAFVETCIAGHDPCSQRSILYRAERLLDLSERKAKEMLEYAEECKLILKIRLGSYMKYVKVRPGFQGEKGQVVAAVLTHNPDAKPQEMFKDMDISDRYIRMIKAEMEHPSSGNTSAPFPD